MSNSKIFDVLHTVPDDSEQLVFTVVSTGTAIEVPIAPPHPAGVEFENANGAPDFHAGDNLLLQSITMTMPYGFGQGTGVHSLGIAWKDGDGNFIPIPEFANNSALVMPDLCCGIQFPGDGLFIRTPTTDPNAGYRLALTVAEINVSMINAPQVLVDAESVLFATYYINVVHTLPMYTYAP